jgi:hypothetical protein
MPFVFSHVEYWDMHFVYGICDGNAHAAVEEYQRRFPDQRIPSRGVFAHIHQTMRETGCLPSVAVQWWYTCTHVPCKVLGTLRITTALVRVFV